MPAERSPRRRSHPAIVRAPASWAELPLGRAALHRAAGSPPRGTLRPYAERFGRRVARGERAPRNTHHRRAIRDARCALIHGEEGADQMYDLLRDPDETMALLGDGVAPFRLLDDDRCPGYAIEHP